MSLPLVSVCLGAYDRVVGFLCQQANETSLWA